MDIKATVLDVWQGLRVTQESLCPTREVRVETLIRVVCDLNRHILDNQAREAIMELVIEGDLAFGKGYILL